MTTQLVTVNPDDSLEKVDQIFNSYPFHHVPVVDDQNKLLGIISKADYYVLCDHMSLFRKDQVKQENLRFFQSLLASEVMTKEVVKLRAEDSLMAAAHLFKANRFHAIPIVDDQEHLKGIISTLDLINYAYCQPAEQVSAEAQ